MTKTFERPVTNTEIAATILNTTWRHQWPHPDFPDLIVRTWNDAAGSDWVEIAHAETGKSITRDYAALAVNFLERNWYERV